MSRKRNLSPKFYSEQYGYQKWVNRADLARLLGIALGSTRIAMRCFPDARLYVPNKGVFALHASLVPDVLAWWESTPGRWGKVLRLPPSSEFEPRLYMLKDAGQRFAAVHPLIIPGRGMSLYRRLNDESKLPEAERSCAMKWFAPYWMVTEEAVMSYVPKRPTRAGSNASRWEHAAKSTPWMSDPIDQVASITPTEDGYTWRTPAGGRRIDRVCKSRPTMHQVLSFARTQARQLYGLRKQKWADPLDPSSGRVDIDEHNRPHKKKRPD